MTREQLDAIRARVERSTMPEREEWRYEDLSQIAWEDVPALLAEVERLRDAHAMAVQVSGELCEKCGWAMKFPDEPCRCELLAEVMRLRRELEDCQEDLRDHKEERLRLRGEVHRLTNRSAFEAGVQAGREQVISYLSLQAAVFTLNVEQMQKNIRTMQFPEDK